MTTYIREMTAAEMGRIAEIDRSEDVDAEYVCRPADDGWASS